MALRTDISNSAYHGSGELSRSGAAELEEPEEEEEDEGEVENPF